MPGVPICEGQIAQLGLFPSPWLLQWNKELCRRKGPRLFCAHPCRLPGVSEPAACRMADPGRRLPNRALLLDDGSQLAEESMP